MGKRFYGVKTQEGREYTFTSWIECEKFVKHKSNIIFKGFNNYDELQEWFSHKKIAHTQDTDSTYLKIYTDGSYNSKTKKSGWAWAAVNELGLLDTDSGQTKENTLSRQIDGELQAAIEAIKWAYKRQFPVIIVHDYAGVGNFFTGDWSPKSEISKRYVREIRLYKHHAIKFEKIYGHSDNEWNDLVDALAKEACGICARNASTKNISRS